MFFNCLCFMEQQLKSELTQQLILDKAFDLFYKNGYESTTVAQIMTATKLSKGAFYHHFTNKKEVVIDVISNNVKKRIYDNMILPLYAEGEVIGILKDVFSSRIKAFSEAEKQCGCPCNNLINEIGNAEPAFQFALRKIIDEWKAALVSLIERGKRNDSIKKSIDSNAVAVYLICTFEGARGIRKIYNNDEIFTDYLSAVNLFIDQLR
jgi:TetR/AcrR family transcriptional regulator, transcriptional repressor for nem operon